jgi:hypothetical protein
VKIQEPLYQLLSFNNMDLTKKVSTSSIGQTEDTTDSYTFGADLGKIEKEVFQVLKTIISDFKNTIDGLFKNDQNIVLPDVQIQLPGKLEVPNAEHTILMLFLSGKGEMPERPAKIFLTFEVNTSSSEIPIPSQLVEKVVEEARQFVNALACKGVFALQDVAEEAADTGVVESGFAIKFSYLPHVSGKEQTAAPQLIAVPSAQKDAIAQVPELINTYHVSGKIIGSQYLSSLPLRDGKDRDTLEKLLAFVSGIPSDPKKIEGNEAGSDSQENRIVEQNGSSENTPESVKTPADLPFKPVQPKGNAFVVPLDIQNGKDDQVFVIAEPAKKTNGFIGDQEWELRGTTLNTGFGQGELKSNPTAGSPLLPATNDVIVGTATRLVDQVRALLNADGTATRLVDQVRALLNADGTVNEALDETVPDETASSEVSPEKLRLLQTRSPEVRAVVQNAVKKVFNEFEDLPNAESIGFSLGKNGSLRLRTSILVSQLTSNRGETINVMKGLGSEIYDRINYLMQPYTGVYIDDKNILQLRALQKDEGASLPDKELSKEQGTLEKRLNELKLLIERSRRLNEWFTQNVNISADNPEQVTGGI